MNQNAIEALEDELIEGRRAIIIKFIEGVVSIAKKNGYSFYEIIDAVASIASNRAKESNLESLETTTQFLEKAVESARPPL